METVGADFLETALGMVGSAVIATTQAGTVTYLNSIAEEFVGLPADKAVGRPVDHVLRLFAEDTCEPLPIAAAIASNNPISPDPACLLIRRDGNEMIVRCEVARLGSDGATTGAVIVIDDVSELRELHRKLTYHATHDLLTGLPKRRDFETRLQQRLRGNQGDSSAVLYLNLDGFRAVNQSCGYQGGDALLIQLGQLLKAKLRSRDMLARVASDGFMILLAETSKDDAMEIAEALREAVQAFVFQWDSGRLSPTATIGVALSSPQLNDVTELMLAAERACREAKDDGGNAVRVDGRG